MGTSKKKSNEERDAQQKDIVLQDTEEKFHEGDSVEEPNPAELAEDDSYGQHSQIPTTDVVEPQPKANAPAAVATEPMKEPQAGVSASMEANDTPTANTGKTVTTTQKAYSKGLAGVGEEYGDKIRSAAEAKAQAVLDAAESIYGEGGAITQYLNELETGHNAGTRHKSITDAILDYGNRIKTGEEDADKQLKANQMASRWTGLTEVAASLANLIAVGEGNAVSQHYKSYSMDWMKKADADAKYHRSRIDNLRERQKALEMHLDQMKEADFKSIQELKMKIAQGKAAAAAEAAAIRAKGEEDAAAAVAKGKMGQMELDNANARDQKHLNQNQKQFEARLEASGAKKDPKTGEWTIEYKSDGSAKKTSGFPLLLSDGGVVLISEGALKRNLPQIMKNATTISTEDREAVNKILGQLNPTDKYGENKGKVDIEGLVAALSQYIGKYPEIDNKLRRLGYEVAEGGTTEGGVAPGYFSENRFEDDFGGQDANNDTRTAGTQPYMWSPATGYNPPKKS